MRGVAGFLILASPALGYWVHPAFYLFTAFVGANLFQSAFSNSCPMMWILRRLGFREESVEVPVSVPAPAKAA